jgi:hypothetical protein
MLSVGDKAYHPMCGWTTISKVYKVTGAGWSALGTNGFYAPLEQWKRG